MGGSSYSSEVYRSRISHHKAAGTSVFTHDDDIRTGRTATKVHEKLDPSIPNSVGKFVRESFDSDTHPESRAVAVVFDNTGSMLEVPKIFVNKLEKLMAGLVKRGIEHPQVLFGAVADATCDRVPLQIGQFESGNEMDEALSLIYLEGGGGGQNTESYELAMYYMARHTDLDCLKKRNQKGFLFISGDELPYPQVKRTEVKKVIGDTIQEDIPTANILAELREKYEVFWFMPANTSHYNDRSVTEPLKAMFGQNYIVLENPADVCEQIIGIIAKYEGIDLEEIKETLREIGADDATIRRTTNAVAKWTPPVVSRVAVASGAISPSGTDDVVRI